MSVINQDFNTKHKLYAARVNEVLARLISPIESSQLQQAMAYSLLAGGKRIRPLLVYATGTMFGAELKRLDCAAVAIEMIHTYSLIHDDLPAMDDDELRRGMPTCHIKFDEATAILAGDALQTLAFSTISEDEYLSCSTKIELVKCLAKASGVRGMCLGQSYDLLAEHKSISLDELKTIHQYKTGALIDSAVKLGMIIAGGDAAQYELYLSDYTKAIGLAFQIQDDILDVIGDKAVMGKNQGTDALLEKNTYPSLMGLEQAKQACKDLCMAANQALDKIPYQSDTLRQLADFIIKRNN